MMFFCVGLLLVSLAQFSVANYNNFSDLALEHLARSQQAAAKPAILPTHFIQSCDEAHTSGVYELRLSTKSVPFTAYCDVESLYGKWLVFQQRVDGSVDFNRSWVQYRDGFGAVGESTEFWLGLEKIHQVTLSGSFELAIELKNETGCFWEAGGFTIVNIAFLTDHIQQAPKLEKAFIGVDGQMQHPSAE
ncbi:hypothetical protein quinque_015338 [Culex quinquefasciatus]